MATILKEDYNLAADISSISSLEGELNGGEIASYTNNGGESLLVHAQCYLLNLYTQKFFFPYFWFSYKLVPPAGWPESGVTYSLLEFDAEISVQKRFATGGVPTVGLGAKLQPINVPDGWELKVYCGLDVERYEEQDHDVILPANTSDSVEWVVNDGEDPKVWTDDTSGFTAFTVKYTGSELTASLTFLTGFNRVRLTSGAGFVEKDFNDGDLMSVVTDWIDSQTDWETSATETYLNVDTLPAQVTVDCKDVFADVKLEYGLGVKTVAHFLGEEVNSIQESQLRALVLEEVASALDTPIPETPIVDSFNDKIKDIKLASDGLDAVVITEPTGVETGGNFGKMIRLLYMRFFNTVKKNVNTKTLTISNNAETEITSQSYTLVDNDHHVGKATDTP